jgi:hypothetical protein
MDYRNLCKCLIEELRKARFQVMLLEDELRREKESATEQDQKAENQKRRKLQ